MLQLVQRGRRLRTWRPSHQKMQIAVCVWGKVCAALISLLDCVFEAFQLRISRSQHIVPNNSTGACEAFPRPETYFRRAVIDLEAPPFRRGETGAVSAR